MNYEFYGMEKTEEKSIEGENIYGEYGTNKYYKEDYLGNKVECDRYGFAISKKDDQSSTNSINRSGSSVGGTFLGGLILITIALAAMLQVLKWAKANMVILSISYVLCTLSYALIFYMEKKEKEYNFVDLIRRLLYWINICINTLFGYSLMSGIFSIYVDTDRVFYSSFKSLIPLVGGFLSASLLELFILYITCSMLDVNLFSRNKKQEHSLLTETDEDRRRTDEIVRKFMENSKQN